MMFGLSQTIKISNLNHSDILTFFFQRKDIEQLVQSKEQLNWFHIELKVTLKACPTKDPP